MQGIYTYIPETNYIPREYSVAAILLLLFMVLTSLVPVLTLLYFYISTFQSMCAVPITAVFCSSLISWLSSMLPMYFLNDFEIVPVAPIITGITFVFTFHIRCISIVSSLYFRILLASFLVTFLSPEIATYINPLTPNDDYTGRATPRTSKRCILYIYSTNTGTEYLNMVYTLSVFFLFKMQFVS